MLCKRWNLQVGWLDFSQNYIFPSISDTGNVEAQYSSINQKQNSIQLTKTDHYTQLKF
jgi:hypothetical protein